MGNGKWEKIETPKTSFPFQMSRHGTSTRTSSSSQRNWCFTSFLPLEHIQRNLGESEEKGEITFSVFQEETCPSTNRPHIQGYVEFPKKITRKQAQHILGDTKAHLELRKGTQKQAVDYCEKSESRNRGPYKIGFRAMEHRSINNQKTMDLVLIKLKELSVGEKLNTRIQKREEHKEVAPSKNNQFSPTQTLTGQRSEQN